MENQSIGSQPHEEQHQGTGWGEMGGGPGDGIGGPMPHPHEQQPAQAYPGQFQQQLTYAPPQPTPTYAPVPPSTPPPAPPIGGGSITRFATPDMASNNNPNMNTPSSTMAQSYAERSNMAYGQTTNYGGPPGPLVASYGGYGGPTPASTPATPGPATTSYAARSAAIQQQPAYPYANASVASPQGSIVSPPSGSFAQRSAQLQQQQPAPYGAPPPSMNPTVAPVQAAPANAPGSAAAAAPGQTSYHAARSAQAHHQARQQQPSSTASVSSFAARSAQAQQQAQLQQQSYYGAVATGGGPQPPQQQHMHAPQPQQQQQSYGGPGQAGGGFGQAGVPPAQQQYQQPQWQQQQQQAYSGAAQQQVPSQLFSSNASVASTLTTPTISTHITAAQSQQQQQEALQQRLLTDATRKVQEHAYYMKQAMDQKNLPVVLDRVAHMVGELGGPPHGQHHQQHQHTGQQFSSTQVSTPTMSSSSGPTNTGISPKLNPKMYYELYMRALEDLPVFQEYLLNLARQPLHPPDTIQIIDTSQTQFERAEPYTMLELYNCTQYCPRVLSRLYLQIAAGSALITSGEVGAKYVLNDLAQAVRCEQNPIRGLFLRNYLLTALRDHLPDTPLERDHAAVLTTDGSGETAAEEKQQENDIKEKGTVKDSYEFVLNNFMEMNKLWVRIQHLPGEGKNKDVKKRRERERNDLRVLVGTNLVRLSQMENVTSKIYGEIILPQVLEHIVVCGDPLSQAYLMDCLVQVFPDEYHIETLPILLNVCPRLRDKVNIRTILQGLMDRLANYLADEELLDESDTNEVKKALAHDAFGMFEDCVQKVFNSRGPKLTSKEVIRLQTALLQFSLKCYPDNMVQISRTLGACVSALKLANASYEANDGTMVNVPTDHRAIVKSLDEVSVNELEKLLSIPLETLGLKVLGLEYYGELISFLPWANRRVVAISLLKAVENLGSTPQSVNDAEILFSVIEPLLLTEEKAYRLRYSQMNSNMAATTSMMSSMGISSPQQQQQPVYEPDMDGPMDPEGSALVSKLVHLLNHDDTDVQFDMLNVARNHITRGSGGPIMVAVIFAAARLSRRLFKEELKTTEGSTTAEVPSESVDQPQPSTAPPEPTVADDAVEKSEPEAVVAVDAKPESAPDGEVVDETAAADPQDAEKEEEKSGEGEDVAVDESGAEPSNQTTAEVATTNGIQNAPSTKEELLKGLTGDIVDERVAQENKEIQVARTKATSCRRVFVFIQETIAMLPKSKAETIIKLYLEMSLTADLFAASLEEKGLDSSEYTPIVPELIVQAYSMYEEMITESKAQQRCIRMMIGTLLQSKSVQKVDYEKLITKTAQFSAKVVRKPDQCQLVSLCSHLFFPTEGPIALKYQNPQRALECLQRSLKLADACTSANPADVQLFVDLLEQYVLFFERKNPVITHGYISGLAALVKEHFSNLSTFGSIDSRLVAESKAHFVEVLRYIKRKKSDPASAELFGPVLVEGI